MASYFIVLKRLKPDFYLIEENFFYYEIFLFEGDQLEIKEKTDKCLVDIKDKNLMVLKTLPVLLKKTKYEEVLQMLDFAIYGEFVVSPSK